MPPAPAKPITAAEFYPTLLDTDRVVATRTAANEPDIAKRVGLLPPVALVDYLAPRLYRGGNGAGVPVKVVDFYDATEPGFDPLKHSALTTLDPVFLCLKTRCIIVNPRPNQPGEYTLEYNTFSAATMRVWRDGRFSQSGQQSDAQWYAVKSPEAAAPEWASLQAAPPVANYNFPVKFLLRHPIAGNQLFFETKVAGVLPAPSLADGDANYLRVARETVPVPAFDAFQGAYNPRTNIPALTAGVGTRGHYYEVSQAGLTVNTTSTTATSASTALSVTSAAGIAVGMRITGAGIAANTTIGAIVGAALTLSAPATVAANTPVTAETFAVGMTGFVTGAEIFYTGAAWVLRAEPPAWRFVGDPVDGNIQIGKFGPNTVFPAALYAAIGNTFGAFHDGNCSYGEGLQFNTFGAKHFNNTYGTDFRFCHVGAGVTGARIGNSVQRCYFGTGLSGLTVGNNCTGLLVETGCNTITFGAGCSRVEVYASSNLVIPANTVDKVYRNGVEVMGDTFAALTYAASIALDFNAATVQTLAATGNVALAASLNVAVLKTKELYITNTTGAAITLTFPAGWTFFPGPAPTSLAAGKQAVLTLRAAGTTDSTVKAAYVAQA